MAMCEDLLHQNSPKPVNTGSIASNSMMQSMPVTELTFMELLFSQEHFINNSHSKLYENSVKDSVTDTKSQIDRQTNMASSLLSLTPPFFFFFYLVKP